MHISSYLYCILFQIGDQVSNLFSICPFFSYNNLQNYWNNKKKYFVVWPDFPSWVGGGRKWLTHAYFVHCFKATEIFHPCFISNFSPHTLSMGGIHSEMPKHNKSVWCRVEWACVLGSNSRLYLASTVWPWTSHLSFLSPKLLILKINRSISNLHIHSVLFAPSYPSFMIFPDLS